MGMLQYIDLRQFLPAGWLHPAGTRPRCSRFAFASIRRRTAIPSSPTSNFSDAVLNVQKTAQLLKHPAVLFPELITGRNGGEPCVRLPKMAGQLHSSGVLSKN
jgi:hypothetical protein